MAYNVQCLHVDNVRASDVDRMVSSTGISQCPVLCCDQLLNLCCPPLPPSPVDPRCPACIHNPLDSAVQSQDPVSTSK